MFIEEMRQNGNVQLRVVTPTDNSSSVLHLTWIGRFL